MHRILALDRSGGYMIGIGSGDEHTSGMHKYKDTLPHLSIKFYGTHFTYPTIDCRTSFNNKHSNAIVSTLFLLRSAEPSSVEANAGCRFRCNEFNHCFSYRSCHPFTLQRVLFCWKRVSMMKPFPLRYSFVIELNLAPFSFPNRKQNLS